MTERDLKILKKISATQRELSSYVGEFHISQASDMSKIHPAIRRGIIGYIGDLFELTKPLSDAASTKLPLNQTVIKQFRNTSTHQYGIVTDAMAYACLMHCIDKAMIGIVDELISNYIVD